MRYLVPTLLALWSLPALAATEHSVDPATGLATWQTETRGIQVRLTQISPDQANAFYQARGFSAEAAAHYTEQCVFMTVVRNVGAVPIEYRLADWRYRTEGQPARAIRSKAEWDQLWQRLDVNDPARIAFGWAQIPATQVYAPGDWNQGMTAYAVPRGARFDLDFTWQVGDRQLSGTLEQVQCADEHR
ncbi:MAG TPA: hypothetical protein PKC12_03080 [Thiobacillaceae bacterium]|nr:hypothetical protein [Thiobacillaceae bacterium]